MHPHNYLRIKSYLGDALTSEPTNLIHDLKAVKSTLEIAAVREAARYADTFSRAAADHQSVAACRPQGSSASGLKQ